MACPSNPGQMLPNGLWAVPYHNGRDIAGARKEGLFGRLGWGRRHTGRMARYHELQLSKSHTNTRKRKVSKGHLILLTDTLPLSYHKNISMKLRTVGFGLFLGFFPPLPLTDLESDCALSCSLDCPLLPRIQMPLQSLTKYHFPSTYKLLVSKTTASQVGGGSHQKRDDGSLPTSPNKPPSPFSRFFPCHPPHPKS